MYTSSFFHFFPPVLSLLFIIFFLFLLFPFMFPPFFIVLFSTCTWQILSFFIWIIAGHRLTGEKENSSNVSFQPMWIIQSKFTNEWTCESSMKMETGIFFTVNMVLFSLSASTSMILYFSLYDSLYCEKLEIELHHFFLIIKSFKDLKIFWSFVCYPFYNWLLGKGKIRSN